MKTMILIRNLSVAPDGCRLGKFTWYQLYSRGGRRFHWSLYGL
jgi:hypothetical protein